MQASLITPLSKLVAKTCVGRSLDSVQRSVNLLETEFQRFFGARLQEPLVELDDIDAGGEEIFNFFVQRGGTKDDSATEI